MKKLLTVFLTLIIALSFSVTAFADVTYKNGDTLMFDGDLSTLESYEIDGLTLYGIYSGTELIDYILQSGITLDDISLTFYVPIDSSSFRFSFSECQELGNSMYMYNAGPYSFAFLFLPFQSDFDGCSLAPGFYFLSNYIIDGLPIDGTFAYMSKIVVDGYTGWVDNSTDDTPTTDTIFIKEERPLFDTPLTEYTVTEGLLLILLVVTILNSAFKSHIRG